MVSPVTYIQETWDEMQKVKWPTRVEIIRLTTIVIIISIIVGLYIGALDFIFTKSVELILK